MPQICLDEDKGRGHAPGEEKAPILSTKANGKMVLGTVRAFSQIRTVMYMMDTGSTTFDRAKDSSNMLITAEQ